MFGFGKNKADSPFVGETLSDSSIELELVYDHYMVGANEDRWESFSAAHDLKILSDKFIIKGKPFRFKGKIFQIFRTSSDILIVRDDDSYQDIHAYSLAGDHLWDIEKLRYPDGKKVYTFGRPVSIKRNSLNEDLLLLSYHPYFFATNLLSGKDTFIWSRVDDTNER